MVNAGLYHDIGSHKLHLSLCSTHGTALQQAGEYMEIGFSVSKGYIRSNTCEFEAGTKYFLA